jgi:uncharacterized protein YjbI with pentapeptide repeats
MGPLQRPIRLAPTAIKSRTLSCANLQKANWSKKPLTVAAVHPDASGWKIVLPCHWVSIESKAHARLVSRLTFVGRRFDSADPGRVEGALFLAAFLVEDFFVPAFLVEAFFAEAFLGEAFFTEAFLVEAFFVDAFFAETFLTLVDL